VLELGCGSAGVVSRLPAEAVLVYIYIYIYIYNFKAMNWFEYAILKNKPGRDIHFNIDLIIII